MLAFPLAAHNRLTPPFAIVYIIVAGGSMTDPFATLLADRDDADAYLVYADWLIAHGDPRGELIVLQHRGAPIDDYVVRHADVLLGPLAGHAVTWRNGFVDTLVVEHDRSEASPVDLGSGDEVVVEPAVAAAELAQLLDHPSARLLDRLVLRGVPAEAARAALAHPVTRSLRGLAIELTDWLVFEDVVAALAAELQPRLAALTLAVADFVELWEDDQIDEDHDTLVDAAHVDLLATATPALASLELVGENMFAALAHPTLRELALVSHAIPSLPFSTDRPLAVPALAVMRHRGVTVYPHQTHPHPVWPIELVLPTLRVLEFHGDYDGWLFRELAPSPILPQLEEVALPRIVDDRDDLEDNAPAFQHLRALRVAEIDGSAEFAARCARLLPCLEVVSERDP